MSASPPTAVSSSRWRWWRRGLAGLALALAIGLGAAICFAPGVERRAAGLFGGLANRVRNRPAQTAAICLGGLVLLWGGVGLLAAGQEVHSRLTRRRQDPS